MRLIESPASNRRTIWSRNGSHELRGPALTCGAAALCNLQRRFVGLPSFGIHGRTCQPFRAVDAQDSGDVSIGMTAGVHCGDRLLIGHRKMVCHPGFLQHASCLEIPVIKPAPRLRRPVSTCKSLAAFSRKLKLDSAERGRPPFRIGSKRPSQSSFTGPFEAPIVGPIEAPNDALRS